jgi:glycosyltransferase involved in cell wall biosynthesis
VAGESVHPDGGRRGVPRPLQPLGFLDHIELCDWLRRARVYISAARYDPFGLLPLQAALNGCALVLSDIPSYRELWDGVAHFFRPDDVSDLRRVWRGCLTDGSWQAPYERARTIYTVESMVQAYRRLYAATPARIAA